MKITVVGAGSWGTALAQLLATSGHEVALLCRRSDVAETINIEKRNPDYLCKATLSENIHATSSPEVAFMEAEACVFATPSQYLREIAESLSGLCSPEIPLVCCSKGVEEESGRLPHEILFEELGDSGRVAALSGPTHAEEVVEGAPSAAVSASEDIETAEFFRDLFATDTFRTYTSEDIVGVEICAAFKNVIAVAVGISYGLGYGDNTAAMIMTRGLAEMSRMVSACGGEAITCMGLAGAGDMAVTCTSKHSRNRRFGEEFVAKGKSLSDFREQTHMVAEGAVACKTLEVLSARYGVELPLTDAVRKVVWEGASPKEVAHELFDRPLTEEFYGI